MRPQKVLGLVVLSFIPSLLNWSQPPQAIGQTKQQTGWWSDPFDLKSRCIHATLLRGVGTNHSRIVWWPEPGELDHSDGPHKTYTWNWMPTSGTSVAVDSFAVSTNLLCAGHSVLPNGELLVTGGTELGDVGIRQISRLSVAATV